MLRVGWLGTRVQTEHDAFDDVVGQGAIPIIHDQDITITEARLALDVGLTNRFGASVVLPFRVVSTRIHYLDGSGMQVDLVQPSTHHRDETLSGIADPMLLGSYSQLGITVRAGMTLPLGRTENDPFAMPDLPHEHIQFGTGTFNPVLALEAGHAWGRWRLAGFGFTQQAIYENSKGYHAGDRYAAGVGGRRAFGSWTARTGIEIQAETFERWHGMRHDDEGNQGRFDAMFAVGGSVSLTRELSLDLAVRIPFVTHVVGGQLDMPALVEVGASYAFGTRAKGHDDDHDHEHEHEHEHEGEPLADGAHEAKLASLDTTGADVADIGHAGARVDLIPVPGKITIFDFWAPWCQPCKTLEPVLVDLAKANPDGVAVRRIDIVDWETPVVAQYLTPRAFDLPHVKIYDATGALVFEESSGPGKLTRMIATIRQLVGGGGPAAAGPAASSLPTSLRIMVTERGFEPAAIDVPSGVPVTLQFVRKTTKTCATEIVIEHDGERVTRELPLDHPVELTLTFRNVGPITYACTMDMVGGTINVR